MSSTITITNRTHLKSLLTLGRIWHRELCLRVTITRTTLPEGPESATLTFNAVKRAEAAAHPPLRGVNNEYRAELYASSDPAAQLWVGFYHMIEERGETRIFGPHFSSQPTLLEKVRAMHLQFLRGAPVHVFLTDLFIADEFGCDGLETNTLATAIEQIRLLANSRSPLLQSSATEDNVLPTHVVQVYGTSATVNVAAGYGLHRVSFSPDNADPDDVDGAAAQDAANIVQRASVARTGGTIDGKVVPSPTTPASIEMRDVYAWDLPVSEVVRDQPDSTTNSRGLKRYARIAGAVFKVAVQRTKTSLAEIGVDSADFLRYVAEYVGKEQAVWFAAVEGVGGVQKGVRDLSYSAFREDPTERDAVVSVAATVSGLRDCGRLGFSDNVVESGAAGDAVSRRVIVQADAGDGLITKPMTDGNVVEGRLQDDVLVR